jgi:hypothetical protein
MFAQRSVVVLVLAFVGACSDPNPAFRDDEGGMVDGGGTGGTNAAPDGGVGTGGTVGAGTGGAAGAGGGMTDAGAVDSGIVTAGGRSFLFAGDAKIVNVLFMNDCAARMGAGAWAAAPRNMQQNAAIVAAAAQGGAVDPNVWISIRAEFSDVTRIATWFYAVENPSTVVRETIGFANWAPGQPSHTGVASTTDVYAVADRATGLWHSVKLSEAPPPKAALICQH